MFLCVNRLINEKEIGIGYFEVIDGEKTIVNPSYSLSIFFDRKSQSKKGGLGFLQILIWFDCQQSITKD